MLTQLAILLAGFSIFTALLLALASVGSHAVPGQGWISRVSGLVLLLGLAALLEKYAATQQERVARG